MNKKTSLYFTLFLIFTAVSLRVARHFGYIDLPPNFAPISAIALFSATYVSNKKQALIIPLVGMLAADLMIGFYNPAIMFSVYLSFALVAIIGLYVKQHKTIANIIGASLTASVLFYLITNFAVWVFSGLYPQTFTGLIECYTMAIPFFRSTLLSDLFYVTLLFGSFELVTKLVHSKALVLNNRANNNI